VVGYPQKNQPFNSNAPKRKRQGICWPPRNGNPQLPTTAGAGHQRRNLRLLQSHHSHRISAKGAFSKHWKAEHLEIYGEHLPPFLKFMRSLNALDPVLFEAESASGHESRGVGCSGHVRRSVLDYPYEGRDHGSVGAVARR
jgi:hypothetical protein